jgi:hypothetical protein
MGVKRQQVGDDYPLPLFEGLASLGHGAGGEGGTQAAAFEALQASTAWNPARALSDGPLADARGSERGSPTYAAVRFHYASNGQAVLVPPGLTGNGHLLSDSSLRLRSGLPMRVTRLSVAFIVTCVQSGRRDSKSIAKTREKRGFQSKNADLPRNTRNLHLTTRDPSALIETVRHCFLRVPIVYSFLDGATECAFSEVPDRSFPFLNPPQKPA